MTEQKAVQNRVQRRAYFRVGGETSDAVLLDYLYNHLAKKPEELFLEAARAFWIPMAYVRAGVTDERLLRKVVLSSFYDFVRQAYYIQQELGIAVEFPQPLMAVVPRSSGGAAMVMQSVSVSLPHDENVVVSKGSGVADEAVSQNDPTKNKDDDDDSNDLEIKLPDKYVNMFS